LGEHLRVGPCDEALYTELTGVPWLTHLPDPSCWAARDHRIVQPADVHATLLQLLGRDVPSASVWGRSILAPAGLQSDSSPQDSAASCFLGQRALRTPAWFMRQVGENDTELFVKPDDRWEVNEVSDRCHDVLQTLGDYLDQFQKAAQTGDRHRLPALPGDL
jgi:arylsulfatase A-like enzyme